LKTIYVLRNMSHIGIGNIVLAADTRERCDAEIDTFVPQDQRHLIIEKHDLHEGEE
jgi:hypothetical protein